MRLISLLLLFALLLQGCHKYGRQPGVATPPDVVARMENGRFVLVKTQKELTRYVLGLIEAAVIVDRHEIRYSVESRRHYLCSIGYDVDTERYKSFGFILKQGAGGLLFFDPAYHDCIHFCETTAPCPECNIIILEPCRRASAVCCTAGGGANVGVIFKNTED